MSPVVSSLPGCGCYSSHRNLIPVPQSFFLVSPNLPSLNSLVPPLRVTRSPLSTLAWGLVVACAYHAWILLPHSGTRGTARPPFWESPSQSYSLQPRLHSQIYVFLWDTIILSFEITCQGLKIRMFSITLRIFPAFPIKKKKKSVHSELAFSSDYN